MAEINEILTKKRALLKLAEAEVKTLLAQISALEDATAEETDFAQYLEEKKAKSTPAGMANIAPSIPIYRTHLTTQRDPHPTQLERNPKGLIRQELLAILMDGQERDLDFIESEIKKRTPKVVGRSALRAFLMKLRNEGVVHSRKAGLFQLTQKDETRL